MNSCLIRERIHNILFHSKCLIIYWVDSKNQLTLGIWTPSWVELKPLPHILSTVRVKSSGGNYCAAKEVLCHLVKLCCFLFLFCHSLSWEQTVQNKKMAHENNWYYFELRIRVFVFYYWAGRNKPLRLLRETMYCKWSMVACEDIYCVRSMDLWLHWWVVCFFFFFPRSIEAVVPASIYQWCLLSDLGRWVWSEEDNTSLCCSNAKVTPALYLEVLETL